MSRHFPKAEFIPEHNAVALGGEPVRRRRWLLKYTKLHVKKHEIFLSHNRAQPTNPAPVVLDGTFGKDFPNIEVDVPVTTFDSQAVTIGL